MPRRINKRKARAKANEHAAGVKPKNSAKKSCGNAGPVESVESPKRLPPLSTSPLEISPKAGEISTFPQLRILFIYGTKNAHAGGRYATAQDRKVIVVDGEK